MMGTTHVLSGLATGLALAAITHPNLAVAATGSAVAAASALAPDLDHPRSRASRSFGVISWVLRRLPGGRHRWALHSALAVATAAALTAIPVAVLGGSWWLPAYAALGYATHIGYDLMTDRPVRLWWPSPRPVWGLPRWARIRTGGPAERWLIRPATFGIAFTAAVLILHGTVPPPP
jgi:membrane-bound metal-dependent hydrolase YbcI (DUF457 family)